jgi:hypothetical protein
VHHRNNRQHSRDIDEQGAQPLSAEKAEERVVVEQQGNGHHLARGLHLADICHGDTAGLAELRHPLAQCRNRDLPTDDDQRDHRLDALQLQQHDEGSRNDELVCDRIEERAECGHLIERAR